MLECTSPTGRRDGRLDGRGPFGRCGYPPPLYGFELLAVGNGVPSTGLRIDEHAREVDVEGDAIPGLDAADSSAAYTITGGAYDSGIALSRGMTYDYVAAEHDSRAASGKTPPSDPSPLPFPGAPAELEQPPRPGPATSVGRPVSADSSYRRWSD